MMETMILALLIASVAVQQVLSQDVSSVNDKADAEAPTWNNRHQHFTMHFGKRLESQELPAGLLQAAVASPRAYDLYPVAAAAAAAAAAEQHRPANGIKFPYWLSIQLERGQTLHAVPPSPSDDQDAFWSPLPQRMPIYSFDRPTATQTLDFPQMIQQQQQQQQRQQQVAVKQQQQQLNGQKLMKLMSGDANEQQESGERAQPSSNFQEDGSGKQQQQPAINVDTRSPMPNQIKLPKHFIPVLFGAGSNFGNYNKKAEPKDNFFMHFGKK